MRYIYHASESYGCIKVLNFAVGAEIGDLDFNISMWRNLISKQDLLFLYILTDTRCPVTKMNLKHCVISTIT